MAEIRMSSDEARSKWREVLDTAVAGNQIIIERYGKPVAVIMPYADAVQPAAGAKMVREETAVYQTAPIDKQTLKAELIDEIKSDLLAEPQWREMVLQYELAQMRQDGLMHLEEEFADYEQRYPKTDLQH
jgi:prevent-host-death family protein